MPAPRSLAASEIPVPQPWSSRSRVAIALTLAAYLTLVGHRPVSYVPGSAYDDQLFTRLALDLASGRWLGPYDQLTLVKGIGFPAFLCLNYWLGLPVNLSLCLCYGLACLYFVSVARPLLRCDSAAIGLFGLLVFLPPAAAIETTRIDRDFFCTAVSLATIAAAVNLTVTRVRPGSTLAAAVLAGGLGAWFWVTREEGIWLLPALGLIALLGWWREGFRLPVIARTALALAVSLGVLAGIGLVNRLVYGRFELTELSSGPFQSALVTLERASYPDWTAYVPVPLAARRKIYDESPTFARLRPYLGPEGDHVIWKGAGCDSLPTSCDEIAGGWFVWALRDAAAALGVMSNPNAAATFFRTINAEVSAACREGRLDCARWLPPLLPPFTWGQVRKFPRQIREVALFASLGAEPQLDWAIASLSGVEEQGPELTSVPQHGPGRIIVVHGHAGTATSDVSFWDTDSTQVLSVRRLAEPKPPTVTPATFRLTLACLSEPCTVKVGTVLDQAVEVPLNVLPSRPFAIGGDGTAVFDAMEQTPLTLRSRASQAFLQALPRICEIYHALVLLGVVCLVVSLVDGVYRRRVTPLMLLALALAVAAGSRMALIALVDATSFRAIGYGYLMPMLPLSVAIAAFGIVDGARTAASWIGPSLLSRADGEPRHAAGP